MNIIAIPSEIFKTLWIALFFLELFNTNLEWIKNSKYLCNDFFPYSYRTLLSSHQVEHMFSSMSDIAVEDLVHLIQISPKIVPY